MRSLAIPVCLFVAHSVFAAKQRVELVTRDRADFAANGVVRIDGSTGDLNIAGWDQPSVEVTTTRYVFAEERKKENAADKLKRIEVVRMASGNGELTITTMRGGTRGIHLDYRIMVPRNTRLRIRHHSGAVVINDVEGDIDARTGTGDIVLQLPATQTYAIDAKVRLGAVYSDFHSPAHHLAGEKLIESASGGGRNGHERRLDLHVDIGGISIQQRKTPAPETPGSPAGF